MRLQIDLIVSLSVVAVLVGCGPQQYKIDDTVVRSGNPAVTTVDGDNPKMLEAIAKARQTLGDFILALQQPPAGASSFAIKTKVTEGETTEVIWLTDLSVAADGLRGVISNEPLNLQTVKLGDVLTVPKQEIVDWMYVSSDNTLIGGFTTRALRDLLTPAERAEFEREVPFKLD